MLILGVFSFSYLFRGVYDIILDPFNDDKFSQYVTYLLFTLIFDMLPITLMLFLHYRNFRPTFRYSEASNTTLLTTNSVEKPIQVGYEYQLKVGDSFSSSEIASKNATFVRLSQATKNPLSENSVSEDQESKKCQMEQSSDFSKN